MVAYLGDLEVAIPRDWEGSFELQLVPNGERRLSGFDGRIIAQDARCITEREIQAFLEEHYRVEVSPELISKVTDAVLDELRNR